ncbi:SURF1 family protein [Nostocoides vanveenii]|uniref:SURF1-like protein n=1 Tax=Nostocoides vanveenii TaxID=330835 RepID=A0ABN2KB29_9MICO
MIRPLLTPRWLGALLLAALFAFVAYHLGWWQYSRYQAKADRNTRISAHYDAPPRPLTDILTARPLPIADEWTHVTATGTYADPTLVARGRTFNGDVGYEVLTPFRTTDGALVLIDRGWIPLGDNGAETIPRIAPAPAGQVTMTGWLRVGEQARGKVAAQGQLASINLPEAAAALGTPLLGGYVQSAGDPGAASTPTAGGVPTPLGLPDTGLGPHQAYAYQWWVSMPLGFILIFFGLRREEGVAADESEAPGSASPPTDALDTRAEARPVARRRPRATERKPGKVRIWDEEDA